LPADSTSRRARLGTRCTLAADRSAYPTFIACDGVVAVTDVGDQQFH
jgi:hypothetical protein